MIKLYKRSEDQIHYWEAWEDGAKIGHGSPALKNSFTNSAGCREQLAAHNDEICPFSLSIGFMSAFFGHSELDFR